MLKNFKKISEKCLVSLLGRKLFRPPSYFERTKYVSVIIEIYCDYMKKMCVLFKVLVPDVSKMLK